VALAPVAPPTPSAAPPPAPPIVANAEGQSAASPSGLTVTFGADGAELNPGSADAIKNFAQSVPQSDAVSFNVLAYSHGQAQDPSSARRLSLARALAVRSALMAAGVPSTRIYVRALGSDSGSGSPDRADLSVMGANAPAATATAAHSTSVGKQE
jgi:outer membrane protein OmpA-like peptidoglycan-associated protein